MIFGIEESAMLTMKRETKAGIELPNLESIKTLGENGKYKYLGILEADTIEQAEMTKKIN